MHTLIAPRNLDIVALARTGGALSGTEALMGFERLVLPDGRETAVGELSWRVQALMRASATGAQQPWLHLVVATALPGVCQRCLGPAQVPVTVDRWFRFVDNEDLAAEEDEDSEEDVLVLDKHLNLRTLIEDEVLLAMPLVPMHERCPQPPKLSVQDAEFDAAATDSPHPFAVLESLKQGRDR